MARRTLLRPHFSTPKIHAMKAHSQLTHFAGFAGANDHHEIIIVEASGTVVADFKIEHTAAGWRLWREKVASYPALGVAVEASIDKAVEPLLQSGVTLYPIEPISIDRYCKRHASSRTRVHRLNAWALANALRTEGDAWRALEPQDALIEEPNLLFLDEVALVGERTALVCQLRQALREYYPTALEAFDNWTAPAAWAFIEHFPTPEALLLAGKIAWEKFLQSHRAYGSHTDEMRMGIFAKAGEWQYNASLAKARSLYALTKISQLRALDAQLAQYRQRITALFGSQADIRLPVAVTQQGSPPQGEADAVRFLDEAALGLPYVEGTALLSFQAENQRKAGMRHARNQHLRHIPDLRAHKSA